MNGMEFMFDTAKKMERASALLSSAVAVVTGIDESTLCEDDIRKLQAAKGDIDASVSMIEAVKEEYENFGLDTTMFQRAIEMGHITSLKTMLILDRYNFMRA